ncbi:MAG: hypothetical protein A3I89_02270 [Candidatus Harrisonbacteria bacterium RIFCSPLOWO2_02_FULL_41_11]|uniref:Type II secretion system protein GspF domain-containing protein n=1 Tax=Candidatus Harrisonbacteria bacterium RIFCSPHIGHO2_02_FULL_42_16 TaxID=1798404 RepID=A0A1G1ZI11_9BACT|nr:MAG: hypothetical protein A3B92_03560 [Candidatus Harrisonbacteria bacterium RIFCSPHIGHO2_02_FULL_42_16]OGY66617.1 MAG: hypothetical protein A3I89_02270 [Candidatus Harrisonbacteria bacterium RIFCSPLOWO2_02_FULL_41_11]
MKFHYIATEQSGKLAEGDLDATSHSEALQVLTGKGLKPTSVQEVKSISIGKEIFGQSVNVSDKVILTRYLSLMLGAGTDLFRAVDILVNDFSKPVLKSLLAEIKDNLSKGNPFYATFEKYPKYFSTVFVSLIKSGEKSGNLVEVLSNLSISLEKEKELKNKVTSALIYPLILLSMSFLMLILLVTFALPRIANVFLSSGVQPPIFSRIIFTVGLFLSKNALIVFPLGAILFAGTVYFLTKTHSGKRFVYFIGVHTPVIKNVMKQLALQRFAITLSSLMRSGLPIISSLEITADTVGSEELKTSLMRIAREGVAKGLTLGDAFHREQTAFPMVVVNLISVSEKAGHIEDILKTLANFYETEVDNSIKIMIAFIEPILLLFIGVLIGTVALAVIVPVYQLVGGV